MKPKTTRCPSAPYTPLKLDQATRQAQAKAAAAQPSLLSLASKVPSYRAGES